MAEYTQVEITAALAAIVDAVADTGAVISDRRFVEDDAEALTLLMSLSGTNEAWGWFITLMQISEIDTNNGCEVQQTLTYTLEAIMPYQRRRADNTTSEARFRAQLQAVMLAVRASRQLGLDARVFHRLMQTEEDFSIMSWAGTGADAVLTHFARFRIEVTNAVFI
jgi:hypothetical protein